MAEVADATRPNEIGDVDLDLVERTAVELANLAGAEIVSALGGMLAVRYKGAAAEEKMKWRDPVSEVDQRVEQLIRARLAERFPDHDIIGEEMDERPGRDHDFVWAVDPIDGTANFVSGYPLFAASIGVLFRGRPVAGAVWCATGHRLRAGVYHACDNGPLSFDGSPVVARVNPAVRRGLAGLPSALAGSTTPWDVRVSGSAAIECAFVACGLLRAARFARPNIWDVAGGIALVRAAGGEVLMNTAEQWAPMERFEAPVGPTGEAPDLRNWSGALAIGQADEVKRITGIVAR